MLSFEWIQDCEEHALQVMEWRNDPDTLRASFDGKPKLWKSFREEFSAHYFSTPHLPPLFACRGGERIAFLRFRPFYLEHPFPRRLCEISINVAPRHRGKGWGAQVLSAVESLVLAQGYDAIIAEIKSEHKVSQRVFETAGYEAIEETEKLLACGERCRIKRYERRLIPFTLTSKGVFVIAEAGSNWRMGTAPRDLSMAKALIDVAVDAGADAVKFQVYRPESIYVENAGTADYLKEQGMEESIRSIFKDLSMPYEMIAELSFYCRSRDIHFMASPFSSQDFEQVDPHVACHKIASYEIGHLRLIEAAARSNKPLILSTGCATEDEIAWACDTFRRKGGRQLILLQCTGKYPADPRSLNLRSIPWLRQRFGVAVGLSDHSRDPVIAPVAAVALGASVVEKHFTLDRRLPGPDHYFSLTPHELKIMVTAIREATATLGSGYKQASVEEEELRSYARRGIQAICPITRGTPLQEGVNVDILRPGKQSLGVHPKYIVEMEGCGAKRDIPIGSGIQHGDW